jgi:hypothetical protein
MQGEGGNGKKEEKYLRHVSLLFLSVLPTTLTRLVLRIQAERLAARKPPDQYDLLAATFQPVTEVTIENREETIYELVESTGSTVWPGNRHHLRSSAECVRQ